MAFDTAMVPLSRAAISSRNNARHIRRPSGVGVKQGLNMSKMSPLDLKAMPASKKANALAAISAARLMDDVLMRSTAPTRYFAGKDICLPGMIFASAA
jgi:hypothetical protein